MSVLGAPPIRVVSSCCTKAVEASAVVLVPPEAVGALGVPVNVGLAIVALGAKPEVNSCCTNAVDAAAVVLVLPEAVAVAPENV